MRSQSRERRVASGWQGLRKVVEIGYSAASHANPLIQVTDLIAFAMKWRSRPPAFATTGRPEAHKLFQHCHDVVWPQIEFKRLSFGKLHVPAVFVDYLKDVRR